jgi:hypothetical protein
MRKILLFSGPLFTWRFANPQSQSGLISDTTDNGTKEMIAVAASAGSGGVT